MHEADVIHVVEDDEAMRESLIALLQEAGYEVRGFASAEELLVAERGEPAGCVISDVRMPGMDGLSLLRRLRTERATLPVVLITAHADVPLAVAGMKAGAADFLEKPFEAEVLLTTVRSALRLQPTGPRPEERQAAVQQLDKLTLREREVLDFIAAGQSNKEIAAKLGVSPRTIEFHRARIMEKTGAKGLPGLVRLWLAGAPPA